MSKKIIIVGGGIVGLCSAYYLLKEGCEVTIIDKSDISKGASFANAGYITPSHLIPLSYPGIITKGLKWMFNSSSPFYVKPRFNKDFLQWTWAFKKSATASKVEKAIPVIKDINLLSRALYEDLKTSDEFDFHYDHKGLLMYYQTEKAGEEEWTVGERGIAEGFDVKHLSKDEVKAYEPDINLNIKGAIYFGCDAHMTPQEFMRKMYAFLKAKGVVFYTNETVEAMTMSQNIIKDIRTSERVIKADEFILAAGSWSGALAKQLGLKLLIEAGKGYSINVNRSTGITMPAILIERKVAVTPMNGFTRFAGTMELGGINHNIRSNRVKAIANAAESYYKDLNIEPSEITNATCGLRPCSPDGLPYIGRTSKYKNLTIASGHAMMGWSLGPATGKLVSEIILKKKPSLELIPFHPDRKFY